jgi:hypothetical protein
MKNLIKILLFQFVEGKIRANMGKIKITLARLAGRKKASSLDIIEDINYFNPEVPKTKRALIALSPTAWITALKEYPRIKYFNIVGLTYELVRGLNEKGYLVDIVDLNKKHKITKKIDLFIAHGGNSRYIIEQLPNTTVILYYISGAYWDILHQESAERYENFQKRKKLKTTLPIKRLPKGVKEEREFILKKAKYAFIGDCPRVIKGYGDHAKKIYITGLGAYLDEKFMVDLSKKDYQAGLSNFIYVGGTGGNIQKGMDLLLEVFKRTPHLHLYIYCNIEYEIFKYCKEELNLNNIHYIYHWRFKPFHKKLKRLLLKTNFTIHAPINIGCGTAFMGSVGTGLIPVGYVDINPKTDCCVLSESPEIEALRNCVIAASQKSPEWCQAASQFAIEYYRETWGIESFRQKFAALIHKCEFE